MKKFNNQFFIWVFPIVLFLFNIWLPGFATSIVADIVTPLTIFFLCTFYIYPVVKARTANFWTALFIFIGILTFGVAESFWVVEATFLGIDPSEDVFLTSFYVIPNLFFLLAAFVFLFFNLKNWHPKQFVLDLLAMAVLTFGTIYILFFNAMVFGQPSIDAKTFTAFLYILLDAIAISIVSAIGISSRSVRFETGYAVIIIGFIFYSAGDTVYVVEVLKNTYMPYDLADKLYLLSFLLFAIGMRILYQKILIESVQPREIKYVNKGPIWMSLWMLIFPAIVFIVNGITLRYVLFFSLVFIIYFMFSLLIQSNISNEMMIEERSNLNATLQARVDERTKELQETNKNLEYAYKHDIVTNLYNRGYFFELIAKHIESLEPDQKFNLILVDIGRIKMINDLYGQVIGDKVLKNTAERLQSLYPDTALCSRLGGDEFALIDQDASHPELFKQKLDLLKTAIEKPFEIFPFSIRANFCAGIANFPENAENAEDLYRCAKMALTHAKKRMKIGYAEYNKYFHDHARRRNLIEQELLNSELDQEFELHYQPQYSINTGTLIGMEALIRWNSSKLGMVSPKEFIPVAEDSGFILKLGVWIIQHAAEQIKVWNHSLKMNLTIGINISPLQIEDNNFLSTVKNIISQTQVDPQWINFEITESSAMAFEENVLNKIEAFEKIGVSFSIDDFGTGYSSFNYLKQMSVAFLKIDKQFIDSITTNVEDLQIVQAIIEMSKVLKIQTVAEGVETKAQADLLTQMGCNILQGYYFGRPVNAEAFSEAYLQHG